MSSEIQVSKMPFADVPQFSKRDVAYVTSDKALRPFYKYEVNLDAFKKVIADKQQKAVDRDLLVSVLKEQYAQLETNAKVEKAIESLAQDNTFTVITAHQPSLFTGPLYYVYKIFSAINLAETLTAAYPDYNFVPIFVTGGEDHDFEEVNHAHIFGKTVVWDNEESGSVGMMQTASLKKALADLKDILGGSDKAQEIYQIIEKAYTSHETYAMGSIDLVNTLFQEYGLVVLGMNHAGFKKAFAPIVKEEIFNQPSQKLVEAQMDALTEAGFGGQATPREINFFYLRDQLRERIVEADGKFKVLNTDYEFSKAELEKEIDQHPERFSPNVVMRPIFQEFTMPNLAYIGGGGELAYWMERQPQFAHFGLNFPMLIRRNSVMWVDKSTAKKMDKLDLSLADLMGETEQLLKNFVKQNTDNEISLKKEKAEVSKLFENILEKTAEIDKSLLKTVKAEVAKIQNSIGVLEGKLMRAEKQNHEVSLNQIRSLKEKLFPNNGLQERYDNFSMFYLKHGRGFFDVLKEHLHPLEEGMVIILEQ